jgi:hypothetical protein
MSARKLFCIRCNVFLILLFLARAATAAATNNPAGAHPRAATPAQNPGLDWRYVESDDYPAYIANLQAIGCPTQTIRDIVTADVVGAFADGRKAALKGFYQNYQYWQSDSAEDAARGELEAQHRALDADMKHVLQGLLGADITLPDISSQWQSEELDCKLAFLPADKREGTKAILLEHDHSDQQAKSLSDGVNISVDTNELQRVADCHLEELGALSNLLSPDEFERVEMATSWTGENLRRAMVHFGPTEEEYRVIFAAWKKHDEELVGLYAARQPDPGNDAVYEQIKAGLTEERYNLYQQTWWR